MPLESLQSIGECPVCMEIMRDPKTLNCQHSYCKECLEGIVQVDDKQRGVIKCPMCQDEHKLKDGQTVSNLEAQLTLKQVLDVIEEYHNRSRRYAQCCSDAEKKLSPRCLRNHNDGDHDAKMEWYCWNCKSFFCKKCLNLHSLLSICGSKFYEVKYCEAYDSFTLYCGRHNAFHSYGCMWCCDTFCNYCLPENHNKEKLSDESNKCKVVSFKEYATKFKNPLLEKIAVMKDYTAKQESLLSEIDKSSLSSQSKIDDFKKYVEERKTIVLSQLLFFLELSGKQMLNSYKSEIAGYEMTKQEMKDVIHSKINSVQDVLQKSEALAESSHIEIITQTKDLQDEFQSILPGDIKEHEMSLPEFYNASDIVSADDFDIGQLLAGVQASFGDAYVSTITNDGSYEPIEKKLDFSTDVDYGPVMIGKLNNIGESRRYITNCLKKMSLLNIVGNTPEEADAGDVVQENKGKGKNKKKNKNKDADSNTGTDNVPEEKLADVGEEKGKKKKKKKKDADSVVTDWKTIREQLRETKVEVKTEANESDESDASSIVCEEGETQSNNQGERGGRKNRRGGRRGGQKGGNKGAVANERRQSVDSTSSNASNPVDDLCTSIADNYILGTHFGNHILEAPYPPILLGMESGNIRGHGSNFQHRGGPHFRGRGEHRGGNMHHRGGNMQRGGDNRGGSMHGRGRNMQFGPARGRGNRGGPRGQQNNHRGRGAPHQRPTSAASLDSLVQCYKCGDFGHRVTDCPQS